LSIGLQDHLLHIMVHDPYRAGKPVESIYTTHTAWRPCISGLQAYICRRVFHPAWRRPLLVREGSRLGKQHCGLASSLRTF